MKPRHLIAPVIALSFGASSADAQLLHYYNFNTGEYPGVVYDQVGTANGGFAMSGASQSEGVLHLQGYNAPGYVEFSDWLVPVDGPWTVSFFARADPGTNGLARIISQGSSGHGFYIGPWGPNNWLTDFWPYPMGQFFQDGNFHSYTLTTDADEARFFVDGVLADTHAGIVFDNGYGTPFRIGAQFSAYGEYYDGDVDNLRIYGGMLTDAQVMEIAGSYQSDVAPEPGSFVLVGTALAGIAMTMRRRQVRHAGFAAQSHPILN